MILVKVARVIAWTGFGVSMLLGIIVVPGGAAGLGAEDPLVLAEAENLFFGGLALLVGSVILLVVMLLLASIADTLNKLLTAIQLVREAAGGEKA